MGKKTKAIKETDIRGNKPWLKKVGLTSYKEETKEPNKTFLIVCEGQTEALYFESFPTISAEVKTYGMGCSHTTLADCTIDLAKDSNYDEVWCIFDMDVKPDVVGQADDFNSAIQKCRANGVKCAYSNDSFELWLYLHFQFTDQKNHRDFYNEQLGNIFGINYRKDGKKRKFVLKLYTALENNSKANQTDAIKRSKKLVEQHEGVSPHIQNPITLVYLLVEELNKYLSV
ncbi:RloB family protein [uncultured Maribacter sp.]|uniref:RloB family protein n=1 Tax=uncultured Maribacter sp. TaxID=431308 RepID=UPI0030EEB9F1|tara:strand:- start:7571 stop:8257 length:687 start_codon:yes stop_codon:yes gene_type:complete